MIILRELLLSSFIGLGMGVGLLRLGSALKFEIPIQSGQKTIFLIGIFLFSLTFRLFWSLKGEGKGS